MGREPWGCLCSPLSPCSKPLGDSPEPSRQGPTSAARSCPSSHLSVPPSAVSRLGLPHMSLPFSSPFPGLVLPPETLFPALFPLKEHLTLQVPALCPGPQFSHLQTKGMSSGLGRRGGLVSFFQLFWQTLAKLPSPSRTQFPQLQCGSRIGFHSQLSLFLQWGPLGQGEYFSFWICLPFSSALKTHLKPTVQMRKLRLEDGWASSRPHSWDPEVGV